MLKKETESAILALLPKYPQKRAALIPALFLAQKDAGALTDAVQARVAQLLELPQPQVKEVVTFYPMFSETPLGSKCHVLVCRTLSCAMRGGRTLLTKIEAEYKVSAGHVSDDGKLSVGTVECLASCGTAPVATINGRYVENLDWNKLKGAIDGAIK